MKQVIVIYILVSFVTSLLIRILPLTLIRKPITNQFICSFLYYVPYVTLAVMTFPAMIQSTQSMISGIGAMFVGIVFAYQGKKLPTVASACCITVFLLELLIK